MGCFYPDGTVDPVTVYLVNKQDPCYLLAVNILGSDLDAVDQADQFFSVYTE